MAGVCEFRLLPICWPSIPSCGSTTRQGTLVGLLLCAPISVASSVAADCWDVWGNIFKLSQTTVELWKQLSDLRYRYPARLLCMYCILSDARTRLLDLYQMITMLTTLSPSKRLAASAELKQLPWMQVITELSPWLKLVLFCVVGMID